MIGCDIFIQKNAELKCPDKPTKKDVDQLIRKL
jgi:hypothetical protein